MKTPKLLLWQRLLLLLCGIGLAVVLLVPVWRIELSAPQYPEGLMLQIYAGKLGGNVDIVNGLNHYIGMRTLHADDFMEFTFLPYIIGAFALFALLAAAFGSRRGLYALTGAYLLFAILAMVDFWRWEYEYGHNLDPAAAIRVPGMTYQPPLIGYKQLLNFGAYSIPDVGGWIMTAVGVALALCTFLVWRSGRKRKRIRSGSVVLLAGMALSLSSCSSEPVPIKMGDACDYCRMNIADPHFGAEALNKKGKAWKFDDADCLLNFLKEGTSLKEADLKEVYFMRFDGNHELIAGKDALLLQSDAIQGPMGGNLAAFATQEDLLKAQEKLSGTQTSWQAVWKP